MTLSWDTFRGMSPNFGSLAQLGEHLPYKQGVIGSSPIASTLRLRLFIRGMYLNRYEIWYTSLAQFNLDLMNETAKLRPGSSVG